jgi:riboflavin synthase
MFTGLVQATGRVVEAFPLPVGLALVIDPGAWDHRAEVGESICISGCCLSVAEHRPDGHLLFHAVPETLAKTTLGEFGPGRPVNLERSLRASDLLGGHLVQGHIDGVGVVEDIRTGGEHRMRIRMPADLRQYCAPKGSVCVDGVSLTVAGLDVPGGMFDVALIPVTLDSTTLRGLHPGDRVNLEMDAMAKMVVHYLHHFAGARPAVSTLAP